MIFAILTTIALSTCLKGQDSNSLAPVIFNGKYCFSPVQTQFIVSKIVQDSIRTNYIKNLEAYNDSLDIQLGYYDTQFIIKNQLLDNCSSKVLTLKSINDNLKKQNDLHIDLIKKQKNIKNKWRITAIAGYLLALIIAL